jgi:hypothetical protein
MIIDCRNVTPGEPLNTWQALGLRAVSKLQGSRDVVLAFDLTGSVGFNDEGRIRLKQIIKDSLRSGDRVYVVPFASDVNPLNPEENVFLNPIIFTEKEADVDRILELFPKEDLSLENTDIQRAEAFVYKGLAQQNQCRFSENERIKPQSIVWITDAPLLTEAGISSDIWVETPADSPFRNKESSESKDRQQWLESLPLSKNTQKIVTNNNKNYDLSVVDIAPTVQEFCTPAPGGQVICSVNSYLLNQLWLPALLLLAGTIGLGFLLRYWLSLQQKWDMTFEIKGDENSIHHFKLKPGSTERLSVGSGFGSSEDWGYLQRRGNRLFHVLPSSSNVKREKDRIISTPEETSYFLKKGKDEHEIKTINKTTLTCTASNGNTYNIVIKKR